MSMQKGKHQGGQTQGYSQRYTQHANYLPRPAAPQSRGRSFAKQEENGQEEFGPLNGPPNGPSKRQNKKNSSKKYNKSQYGPEVSFHVAQPGFPGPQQGNGPNGHPGGPQGMSRQMHHPGHHGGPPGPGNPSLPPPGSAGGPGQQGGQVQQPPQNQGPQGPAPTSTPPGQDMGKQPPHMQQGQSQMTPDMTFLNFPPPPLPQLLNQDSDTPMAPYQWAQMQLSYGVATAARPASSQSYYAGQRGPTPRMTNHRGQIVNMPTTHVGQQLYSHQVQMQGGVLPQMYSGQVVPAQLQQQMFVHQQIPMFPGQPPRHQNHTGSGFYPGPAPQQILMTHQQALYSAGYQQHTAQQGHQYYYPTSSPVGMPRPGSGVPGGPGPQMAQPQPQQVVPGGQQPQQMGQPGQVPMAMVPSGPPVGGGSQPLRPDPMLSSAQSAKQARRKFALDIVDPKTGKNINDEIYEGSTTSSPPGSENSSARQTPQPSTGPAAMDLIADFAARVAKVASEDTGRAPALSFSESSPSPPSEQILNGPPDSNINSIQDQSNSIPINVAVEESQWQTTQSKHTLKSEIVSEEEIVTKLDNVDNNNVKLVTEVEIPFAKEFVPQMTPSVSLKDIPIVNSKVSETKEHVSESQPIPVIINKEPQPVIETNSTPVVSANANTPAITLIHKSSNKDSFPALKSSNNQANQNLSQSPRRKAGRETSSAERNVVQNTSFVSSASVSTNQTPEVKLPKKEDFAVPQIPQPKERREKEKVKEKGGRGRREKSSQSRERADKSRSSTERIPSKSRERDNERKNSLQSRERETEKSQQQRENRSKSREEEKPVVKKEVEAVQAPTPSPILEPEPVVLQKPVAQLPPVVRAVSPPAPVEDVTQPNGETTADTSDGKGVKQHQQNAKGAKRNKMRSDQPTRKGTEKETVEEAVVAAPPPATEVVIPVEVAPPTPVPTPTPVPAPVSVPAPVDIPSPSPTEDQTAAAEEVDPEQEESDKLVLARNEENTKVSAAAAKEDVPPIIENLAELKTIQPPPKLLPYSDDQWSPVNPDGKKKYERDFLMELKEDPKSKKKPDNLPDLEVVLKDTSNRQQPRGAMMDGRNLVNRSHTDNFTPGFMRQGGGGQSNSRGPPPKRNSQQGKPTKGGKPTVIHLSLSLREDVKLHETENAWKPGILKKNVPETEAKTEDLYKKVRGVLNKLTPQKFDTLVSQVQALPIDNSDRLQGVINLVFEKAVDEPNFSVAYAQMCKVLSGMQVPAERKSPEDPEFVNFRKLIVNRCQYEFEKNTEAELNKEAKLQEIKAQTDPEKKKELTLIYEEEERRVRMKSVGNIRFIGELFKLQMLTTSIMHRCIRHLLSQGDEESLEGLCKLLTTIGKDLESKTGPGGNANDLTPYFQRMKEIATKRGQQSVSSRVRFMLQDVIELRLGKWIPRRDDANPKTMDQIQKEAEKETMDMHIALSNAPNTPRRQDDRGNMGDRDRRGGKNQRGGDSGQQQDGWQSVPARTNRNLVVDTSKIKVKQGEIENVSLGSGNQFSKWSRGASTARVDEKKAAQPYVNMYSVLGDNANINDEKRGPPMPSQRPGPGKSTPSPSIEKERMLASFKTPGDVSSRSSRSSSVQQSSRSSSRDNSVRRNEFGSQPGSVTTSNEDISRTYPEKVTSTTSSKAHELNLDDIVKKSQLLIAELLSNNLFVDCTDNVLETFIPSQRHEFVRECLNAVLEKTSHSRLNVGRFMCHLIQQDVISIPQYLQGLQAILEFADDIAIDVPKIWLYLAETIVPIMSSELLSFLAFSKVVQEAKATQLVLEVLQLLVKDKGPSWIRERWDTAGLKWTDFLEPGLVDDFVKNNKLEYTVGAVSVNLPAASSPSLTMDQIRQKLVSFLKPEQGSTSSSFDHVCDWISANVGDLVKEPQFIRALMTAICESAIFNPQSTTWKLKEDVFQQHHKLLLKYVDNNENLELQCIYAIQSLDHGLEHPQGLLCAIFQELYDNSVFSYESFIAWESSKDPAEQSGKGVALKSLTSFYTALKEGDSSCDES